MTYRFKQCGNEDCDRVFEVQMPSGKRTSGIGDGHFCCDACRIDYGKSRLRDTLRDMKRVIIEGEES